jgi:hypothetical protein
MRLSRSYSVYEDRASVVSQKFVEKIWLRHQAIFLAP